MLSSRSRARPPRAPRRSRRRRGPRPRAGGPATPRGRAARPPPPRPPSAAWFSLMRITSYSPKRWLSPPPSADRALLERAQPGRRLARVEDSRPPAPSTARRSARSAWRSRTAGRKFSAVRSAVSSAGGAGDAQHRPALAPLPLRPQPLDGRVGIEPPEHRLGDVEPGDHPGRLLRDRGHPARLRGTVASDGDVAVADVLGERGRSVTSTSSDILVRRQISDRRRAPAPRAPSARDGGARGGSRGRAARRRGGAASGRRRAARPARGR